MQGDLKELRALEALTSDEMEVIKVLRKLKPHGSMKITTNQNNSQLVISLEERWVVDK